MGLVTDAIRLSGAVKITHVAVALSHPSNRCEEPDQPVTGFSARWGTLIAMGDFEKLKAKPLAKSNKKI